MDNSLKMGFMAVFAVSGSVVFLTMLAHNRLHSDFFTKLEFQITNSEGATKEEPPKKVRSADNAAQPPKACGKKKHLSRPGDGEGLEAMPKNWQVRYKGILQCRNLRGYIN